jgi:hypothetical protein
MENGASASVVWAGVGRVPAYVVRGPKGPNKPSSVWDGFVDNNFFNKTFGQTLE